MISFLIWNGDPELFSIGSFSLRWYGLLFALGFLVSQQLLYYMFRKEGKPEKDVDTLTLYMVIATILGARLGHVIFYQPELFTENPLGVILPFEFTPKFRFTGLQGLASHGGAFAILFALWLYARKRKPGQNYLQTLDRIVILVALTGCFIRLGNFFNSEIIGKKSDSGISVIFSNGMSSEITDERIGRVLVKDILVKKGESPVVLPEGQVPINMYLFFKTGVSRQEANDYIWTRVEPAIRRQTEHFLPPSEAFKFDIYPDGARDYIAKVSIVGFARHPAQLYESISCLLLFLWLFWIWNRNKNNLPEGRIFGIFMIVLWGLRFAYEYLKEPQVDFENTLPLYMGQILSIPLFLAGVFILVRSYRIKPPAEEKV
ncbi:MAG: prolipoprotein diacylglyceryl transferase [Cyclobacteriaceae bacterium]|nr:prolipoprotein diacylglyceryl transferase [Cyclobacteriaceae bacterium]